MAKNMLSNALPHQAEHEIKILGKNLKTARIRRNLTLQNVAEKVGVSRNLIAAAEKGNPSSSIALYITLLWAYDLIGSMNNIADPLSDKVGLRWVELREPKRVRAKKGISNDF